MYHPRTSRWSGFPPRECDRCHDKLRVSFVHGPEAIGGKWVTLCLKCWYARGTGFGEGRGTMFTKGGDGFWWKVPNE